MRRRLARFAIAAAAVPCALAACMDERDRLTPPTIELTVEDSTVAPGSTVGGRIVASDPNGIMYVSIRLRCAATDSLLRAESDGTIQRRESIALTFTLDVPESVPANTALVLEAETIDDQDFSTKTRDTVYARVSGVPGDTPPSHARCDNGIRSR